VTVPARSKQSAKQCETRGEVEVTVGRDPNVLSRIDSSARPIAADEKLHD